nr:unnamed protein product [Callosobruchus chinensis]
MIQGRPGCLAGVDKKLADKEERTRQRKLKEEKKRQEQMCSESLSSSLRIEDFIKMQENPDQPTSSDESLGEALPSTSQIIGSVKTSKRGRKGFITPKLVAASDRCQLSIRDSVYILQAVVEALGLSCDDFPINKSSIQRIRTQSRKGRAEAIKLDCQNNLPEMVTVHRDGKLLPGLDVRSSKEERLPILISFGEKEQLLAVPKLESSSGQDQAKAILTALHDWDLEDKVQIMCCETTASNTGRLKEACVLLEQKLHRELLLFACRHHVYELVYLKLKSTKSQVALIYRCLKRGYNEKKIKIRPPGAMHQARWMARAIYSLKICLLQSQFKINAKDKQALLDICLFIASLKEYETVNEEISKAALSKFCQHLWYLSEEITVLSLFDDEVDEQTKANIVANLQRATLYDSLKRYVPSKEDMSDYLYGKSLQDFVSDKSTNLFSRLKIDINFLKKPVSTWYEDVTYLQAKRRVLSLRAVNDTAERAVKLIQDFHGLVTAREEQKQFLLRCVQEHRNLYPD